MLDAVPKLTGPCRLRIAAGRFVSLAAYHVERIDEGRGLQSIRRMQFYQREIRLPASPRGFHLVTAMIVSEFPEISNIGAGMMHVLMKHTSASLSLNENADPTVRTDFESHFNRMVPENAPYFQHTTEGPDDMPAHLKASLLGSSVLIPITAGRLNLGTWQGIYFCEHRDHGGPRRVVVTAFGTAVGRGPESL